MRGKRVMAAALMAALSLGSAMGSMAAGWEQVGTSDWKYLKDDGKYAASAWVEHTDGHWYYLKDDTLMAKGWVLDPTDNHWYFTDSTGALVSGLIEVNNNVYYMNETHDGSFGALFVGQKTYNGVTYTFTENGTTNGKPYTSRKYNTDGTAIAVTTTTASSSYSGGHFVPSAPTTEEKMEAVENVMNTVEEKHKDVVSKIEIAPPSGASNESIVTVKLTSDGVTPSNEAGVQTAVKEAAQAVLAQADDEKGVEVKVPDFIPEGLVPNKSYKTVQAAEADLDRLVKKWITDDNYNDFEDAAVTITVYMNGEPVTYTITLADV